MSDRAVAAIWCGGCEGLIDSHFAAPGLPSHLFRSEEVTEVDWLMFCPEASGASEVGYAGFGADSRAGEDGGSAALGEQSP
jgi:hypothetical protein